jgi:hypothetical protein
MTDIAIIDSLSPSTGQARQAALRAAAGYAADAAELRMFAEMLGIPLPERKSKITEGEDR